MISLLLKFVVQIFLLASVALVCAEPPVHGGYGHGHGHGGGGGGSGYDDGGYIAVSPGHQSSEGLHVDHSLLHKVKEALLEHENSGSHGGGGYAGSLSSSYGPPSGSYGPPSPVYGVPSYSGHVKTTGIELGHVQQGIQVAEYYKAAHGPSHSSYSVPSYSYGAPSVSSHYSAPSLSGHSSGSYSHGSSHSTGPSYVGIPSSSYGVPSFGSSGHHHRPSHGSSHSFSSYRPPSSSYGPPRPTYGVPHHH
uniref:Uncharacterized protein n=1 Tax=Anopheles christyi TaxID=43041 RepID=A0A182JY70_9DIPT